MASKFFRAALLSALLTLWSSHALAADFRPPAVPLVAHDPYFSVWSTGDRLTETATTHWTGAPQSLASLVRIDGQTYRLMGTEPQDLPVLPQTGVDVLPTRTIYRFASAEVRVTLTFTTPALPQNLEVLARPATYLTWEVTTADGRPHAVAVYFDAAAELCVNRLEQPVTWSRLSVAGREALCLASSQQPVLAKKGDNLRIDWGTLYVAPHQNTAPLLAANQQAALLLAAGPAARGAFVATGKLPTADDVRKPRPANDAQPVAAVMFELGQVGAQPAVRHLTVAYDDLYAIEYFHTRLRPYWRRNGAEAADLLRAAEIDYERLTAECRAFDEELMADLTQAGGEKFARICALAYRQCLAANKLAADAQGQPLLFPKENFSNGCIATVDVLYPMAPLFLLLSPTLTKASLEPILAYAESPRWTFPFAPHDLGTYPKANGQVYGGGERTEKNQMPVEESGNMLLLVAALARSEGTADYAARHWGLIQKWAEYLQEKGFDPENQLCTDDFAGHLAHNVNLSAKAIAALGAYALLCDMRGLKAEAETYRTLAREFAQRWVSMASDGDHYRLAFDKPGTWSQKYNLVWDRILGLNLFPADVATKEMAYYRRVQQRYGLPLDNRTAYTKLDWTLWTATLTRVRGDFEALVNPVYAFLNETPDRVPMTDWYWTDSGKKRGFQARPVVGGVFLEMLYHEARWKKYVSRDRLDPKDWAPLPPPRQTTIIAPTARELALRWQYTFTRPEGEWYALNFDASDWNRGLAGFGTPRTPGAVVRTLWKTPGIWLRREFEIPQGVTGTPLLRIHHDEDAVVYLNGVLAAEVSGHTNTYEDIDLMPQAAATLHPGRNVLAIHCRQTRGGQYIDAGLAVSK
jgi:hypothetical protein